MYEDEWREYSCKPKMRATYYEKQTHFPCNEGIALSTHKRKLKEPMHALALKLLLLELNSYDF